MSGPSARRPRGRAALAVVALLLIDCKKSSTETDVPDGVDMTPTVTIPSHAPLAPGETLPEHDLSLQQIGSENSQATDGQAEGSQHDSAVRMKLASDGTASVEDRGEYRESAVDEVWGFRETTRTWTTRWTGTWRPDGEALSVVLTLDGRDCKELRKERENTSDRDCPEIDEQVALECTADEEEQFPDPSADEGTPAPTWRCDTTVGVAGGTAMQWIFGKSVCLRAVSGLPGQDTTYVPCESRG